MTSARAINWKAPGWLFWLAAPLAPIFIALGALICIGITILLGHDQSDQRGPERRLGRRQDT